MPKRKDRVILDTNLLISFLLTKDFSELDKLISDKDITLVYSYELINEFIEVSQRPKFKKYFDIRTLQQILDIIRDHSDFVNVESQIELCRDPKDDFLLALAKDGAATHLITGDNDLLELKKFGQTKI